MAKRREGGREAKDTKTATRLAGHQSAGGLWGCGWGTTRVAEYLAGSSWGEQAQHNSLLSRELRGKRNPREQSALRSLASGALAGLSVKTII